MIYAFVAALALVAASQVANAPPSSPRARRRCHRGSPHAAARSAERAALAPRQAAPLQSKENTPAAEVLAALHSIEAKLVRAGPCARCPKQTPAPRMPSGSVARGLYGST